MATPLRILMVVTNHSAIEGLPRTGIWFSEFSEPFDLLIGQGANVTVASPRGGPAPVDPRGYPSREQIAGVRDALERLNATLPLSHIAVEDFDAVFFPGGHGPMFDLATDAATKKLIAAFWESGKPVAAVCHGPAALLDVPLSEGTTLLRGKTVTGFTNGEDSIDALFPFMPFSLQTRMTAEGAHFVEKPPRANHVEVDGKLVTGQNPASAEETARVFLEVVKGAAQ